MPAECTERHRVARTPAANTGRPSIGLPNDRGLLHETTDRLTRWFLPGPPAIHELWRLAGHIVRKVDDLAWLGSSADHLLSRLAA